VTEGLVPGGGGWYGYRAGPGVRKAWPDRWGQLGVAR